MKLFETGMFIWDENISFIKDSFDEYTIKHTGGPLIRLLRNFLQNEAALINEETLELLEPFFNLQTTDEQKLFSP